MRAQPSAAELAQYGEAVTAGVDPETARLEIWPSRKWTTVLSLVHPEGHNDPFLVGWTTCATCLQHVTNCKCASGPAEPAYITNWRPDVPPSAGSTPVDRRKLTGESYLSDVAEEAGA